MSRMDLSSVEKLTSPRITSYNVCYTKLLREWRKLLDEAFSENLALNAKATSDAYRGKSKQYAAQNVTDANPESYWATDDGITNGSIELDLGAEKLVSYVLVQEYIQLGQRVKSFSVRNNFV